MLCKRKGKKYVACFLSLLLLLIFTGCGNTPEQQIMITEEQTALSSGSAYRIEKNNQPDFTESDMTTEPFEEYSALDSLGRCGVAYANICQELMPTEERGEIGQIKPTGWHTVKYDCVDGKYLYNRCHLIGYQLAGENANEKNLITGTRYMNVEGMLPFENEVAGYVQETGNHVLYRVTPVFEGNNLVAEGVRMEALSVEDNGAGVKFHVFVYNIQPGVTIDYATGDSKLEEEDTDTSDISDVEDTKETESQYVDSADADTSDKGTTYILNTNTKKFHYPSCSSVSQMKDKNKKEYTGTRDEVIAQGYDPCKRCNP